MDILKRELAPISSKAWEEIDERAKEVLKLYLSARKFVKVRGPKGLDYSAITEGRVKVHHDDLLNYGIFNVKPLIEPRVSFKLSRWELDNVERGAKGIYLDPLDEAVKRIAFFEEKAIYHGLKEAHIAGIEESSSHELIVLGDTEAKILASIAKGVMTLEKSVVGKPYTLVVSESHWCKLNSIGKEISLISRIEDMIGGKVIVSRSIDGAILLPLDDDNIELTIGEDFSIGYQEHTESEVKLFITETFTFRILDNSLIVLYK
jgi:uncharacterized linocin/CFP29 family protein